MAVGSGGGQSRHVEPLAAFLRVPEVILKLLVEPAFSARVERYRKTDRHLRADAATPVQDAGQRLAAYAERRGASVTVRFRGARHSSLSTSPGCGGLCIFIVTSVVVLVVHVIDVLAGADKRNTVLVEGGPFGSETAF